MTRLAMVLGAATLTAVVGLSNVPSASAEDKCGDKGQPSCPLQGWMEKNMQVPFEAKDMKALAAALEKVTKMSPDKKWNEGDKGWSKIAADAAKAAKADDFKTVRTSCKTCHKAWRKKYKAEHRMKPVPGK